MEIDVRHEDDATIIEVVGQVTIRTAPQLLEVLKQNTKRDRRLVVSLADVDYMDSSGVGVLVTSLKYAASVRAPFALARVQERVCAILELTRLTRIFKIFPDIEKALKELS